MNNKTKASELIFLSKIMPDGKGIEILDSATSHKLQNESFFQHDIYTLNPLSLSEKTYIASGMSTYVVRKVKSELFEDEDKKASYNSVHCLHVINSISDEQAYNALVEFKFTKEQAFIFLLKWNWENQIQNIHEAFEETREMEASRVELFGITFYISILNGSSLWWSYGEKPQTEIVIFQDREFKGMPKTKDLTINFIKNRFAQIEYIINNYRQ